MDIRLKIYNTGKKALNQYKIYNREKLWRSLVKQKIEGDKLSKGQKESLALFYKSYYPEITPLFHEWYFEK